MIIKSDHIFIIFTLLRKYFYCIGDTFIWETCTSSRVSFIWQQTKRLYYQFDDSCGPQKVLPLQQVALQQRKGRQTALTLRRWRKNASPFKTILEVPPVWRRVHMKMSQNNPDKDDQTSGSKKTISLPLSRVRLIMKSSPDVSSINQDALFLTTKATVSCNFIRSLSYADFIRLLLLIGVSTVSLMVSCKMFKLVSVSRKFLTLSCIVEGAVCPTLGYFLVQQRLREGNQLSVLQRPG